MKIISLRFANLNSLPGPYLIRFDVAPLADTGLFAITGPTGAGKSTLLDAIAVGLYGRVPRHDRQVGEMVSRHAPQAWSEVEFEVHETNADTGLTDRVRYRSRWEVKRKTRGEDKGGLGQDAMSLVFSPSGEAVVSGKEAVPAKVSELSGLDFGQFEQAVLLSQGKFARFLHAPEKERSALLEKMTNVGIYSRLSVAAFEKAKEEEQQTKLLEATLNATRLLPIEMRQRLENQLNELGNEVEMTYEHQQELSVFLSWRTILDHLAEQLTGAARQVAALQTADETLRPAFERLTGHARAAALATPLALAEAAQQELSRDTEALTQLQSQLPALAAAAETADATRALAASADANAQAEAERLRPVLQEAQRQDVLIGAAQMQLAKDHATHAASAQSLADAHADQQRHNQELTELNRQKKALEAWLLDHNQEIDLKDALAEIKRDLLDLEKVNTGLARLEKQQELLVQQHTAADADRQRLQQAASEAQQKQQQLREKGQPLRAEHTALLAGAQPADLKQREADLTARLHLSQRLLPLAQTGQTERARTATLDTELAAENTALEPVAQAIAQLESHRQQGQRLLESYERERRMQQALADLNTHRHQLHAGQPCPLCGALEHAFAADFAADADEQEQRVAEQKQALARLDHELRQTEQDFTRRRTAQDLRHTRRHEAAAAAALARQQVQELAALLAPLAAFLPDPTDLAALEKLIAETADSQAAAITACHQLEALEGKLAEMLTEHTLAREAAQTAENHARLVEQQQQTIQRDLATLKADLANHREQAANYRAQVQSMLAPHQLKLPAAQFGGLLATLAERASTYEKQRNSLRQAQEQLTRTQAEHNTRATTLAEQQAQLHAADAVLAASQRALDAQQAARHTHYAGPNPAAEAERLHQHTLALTQALQRAQADYTRQQQELTSTHEKIGQRQADLARHEANHQARQTELAAALTTAGFAAAAEAQALMLPAAEAERLTQLRQQHLTNWQAARQLQARLADELAHQDSAALTSLTTSKLTAQLTALSLANDTLQQQIGEVAGKLAQDDEARQQQAEGLRQLTVRQQEQARWQDLAEQIGSARGDKFSQFAQGLTLSHLARLANLRLRQLTGRYTILKTPNRNLELQIIDHDQADTVRPMASLSGGESFLVSLALALGLSELAGYKARIESLFIDEGFGTLDPDALNTALDALERLQHSGKMIGVISHVADLKDRIGTQIRVQPGAGGNSTVRVVDVVGKETRCDA